MQSDFNLTYKPLGDATLLIEWPAEISKKILLEIITIRHALENAGPEGVTDIWSAYRSLAISYDPALTSVEKIRTQFDHLELRRVRITRFRWTIPVCYGVENDRDLHRLAEAKGLSTDKVISIHSAPTYTVYFTGFLPGFMYLGGLDERLHLARKPNPERSVPAGSVAIGGEQTGIYPSQSPGGWYIIGKTPVSFFDSGAKPPCFVNAGDEIVFEPVSNEKFQELKQQLSSGTYQLKQQQIHE